MVLASFAALAEEKPAPPGMILTWTGDPTTSIIIDWHRLAENEEPPAAIEARPRGTDEWRAFPAERFPFPHSDRLIDRIAIEGLQPDTEYELNGNYLSIVMGDSDHSNPIAGEQTDWMRRTLEERRNIPHLIPVYHVPAWPSNRSFDGRVSAAVREHWVPIFEQNHIRLALEHHDHTYKRTVPIFEGEENSERGIVYLGDGSWAMSPRRVHSVEDTWYLAEARSVRHCLIISVHPDRKEIRAINPDGEEIDTITIPARTPG